MNEDQWLDVQCFAVGILGAISMTIVMAFKLPFLYALIPGIPFLLYHIIKGAFQNE